MHRNGHNELVLEEQIRMVLVEDDLESGEALMHMLERRGIAVTFVQDLASVFEVLDTRKIDAVVTDIRLGTSSGVDLLREVRKRLGNFPVILLTGYDYLDSAIAAVKLGAQDYILKPLDDIEELLRPLRRSVHEYRLCVRNSELEKKLRASERRYRELFEHMSTGVVVLERSEPRGQFLVNSINKSAMAMDGIGRGRGVGEPVADILPMMAQNLVWFSLDQLVSVGAAGSK